MLFSSALKPPYGTWCACKCKDIFWKKQHDWSTWSQSAWNGPISSHVLFEVWLFAFNALPACSKMPDFNILGFVKCGRLQGLPPFTATFRCVEDQCSLTILQLTFEDFFCKMLHCNFFTTFLLQYICNFFSLNYTSKSKFKMSEKLVNLA